MGHPHPVTEELLVKLAVAELESELRTEKQRITRARKMYLGCEDCGYRRHPEALQFDHRPGETKLGNVSQWTGDVASMLIEMAKCSVVCANCHAIRTAMRRDQPDVVSSRGLRSFHPDRRFSKDTRDRPRIRGVSVGRNGNLTPGGYSPR